MSYVRGFQQAGGGGQAGRNNGSSAAGYSIGVAPSLFTRRRGRDKPGNIPPFQLCPTLDVFRDKDGNEETYDNKCLADYCPL